MTAPNKDDIEVTLFGRGIGESIALHLPGGDWMIIDSFEHKRVPVAMGYLDSIKVPRDRVKVIVVTHFDKDHYVGIDKLHDRYPDARLMVTAALSQDMFKKLFGDASARPALGALPGTIERAAEREISSGAFGLVSLGAGTRVAFVPEVADVMALSPTHAAAHQSNLELASAMGIDRAAVTTFLKNDNRCSIVLSFQMADGHAVLLAGDLLADPPAFGWQAILTEPNNAGLDAANLIKVPHHGGASGDDPAMWERLVSDKAHALVAPYSPSGLPRASDIGRLCELGHEVWQAAPSTTRFVVDEFGNQREQSEVGMVRARRTLGDPEWHVTCQPPAFRASPQAGLPTS